MPLDVKDDYSQTDGHDANKVVGRSPDSLARRYVFKLGSNFWGALCSFLTQSISVRILGPANFGEFSFVTRFFQDLVAFFDSASSQAFYTKLSQRPKDRQLVIFYFLVTVCLGSCVLALSIAPSLLGFSSILWPGVSLPIIFMGALFAVAMWVTSNLMQIVDALGATVLGEFAKTAQKTIAILVLAGMALILGKLSLTQFFLFQFGNITFMILSSVWALRRHGMLAPHLGQIERSAQIALLYEFHRYCSPLVVLGFFGFLVGTLDRWLVQHYSGSVQQGYLGAALQLNTACFLFTSAMVPLITRELSISFAASDIGVARTLFLRHSPLLFCLASALSIFGAVNGASINLFFAGAEYAPGAMTTSLLLLFPAHQTYGQLSAAVLYAAGHTKLYRNLNIAFLLVGLPISAYLLIPNASGGNSYGSVGVALKMVVLQAFSVNTQLWFVCRLLGIRFRELLIQQLAALMVFASIASSLRYILLNAVSNPILNLLTSGVCYSLICSALLLAMPRAFGIPADLRARFSAKIFPFLR